MTYEEALAWLYARRRTGERGTHRVRALLARLGHPEAGFLAVHVLGTNGKGSVVAYLEAAFRAAGLAYGAYTSPHLVDFRERIRTHLGPVPREAVVRFVAWAREEAWEEPPGFFDLATALAFLHFRERGVALAAVEAGVGGEKDATNALSRVALTVLTNVGEDHLEALGGTLEAVAREKAGIFRGGVPALTAARGEGLGVLRAEALARKTPLWVLGEDFHAEGVEALPQGLAFTLRLERTGEALRLTARLLGPHQAENLALAALSGRLLGAGWEAVKRGVARAENPGRLQRLLWRGRELLLDGAHNPEGALALREALRFHGLLPAAFVLGFSRDKDHAAMAEALRGLGPVVLTRYASPRSEDPRALLPLFPGAKVVEDPLEALAEAFSREGRVVVAGSLYLVGEVLRRLEGLPAEERWQ